MAKTRVMGNIHKQGGGEGRGVMGCRDNRERGQKMGVVALGFTISIYDAGIRDR